MNYTSEHKELSIIRHQLDITVEWTDVQKNIQKALDWFRTEADIPGFRKGKASDQAIKAKLGEKAILKRTADFVMSDAFNDATKEIEKKPISAPKFEFDDIVNGKPFSFTALYHIEPPDPQKLTEEIRKKHYDKVPRPDDVIPGGLPNISTSAQGYGVSPEVFKDIPALKAISDQSMIPDPFQTVTDPSKSVRTDSEISDDILDPEELIKPPDLGPKIKMPESPFEKESEDAQESGNSPNSQEKN